MINKITICFFVFLGFIFLIGCTNDNKEKKSLSNNNSNNINLIYDDYSIFNDFDMNKDNAQLKINGQNLNFTLPIYLDKNRYYFPLNEIVYNLNGKGVKNKDILSLKIKDLIYSINLSNNTVKCPNKEFKLKKDLLNAENIYYICFSDLSNMLDLYTRWDKDNKIINCKINSSENIKTSSTETNNNNNNSKDINIDNNLDSETIGNDSKLENTINDTDIDNENTQIGLIRFEDICLTSQSYDKNYFENLRVIGTYMNEKNIPYHIAWIPRYKNPNFKIDNNPLTKNNFDIAEMVYTLDYLKNNNAVIGLHGYTHQFGHHESAAGFEFGKFEPSPVVFREKIEKAIETASYLDIQINFFEVPHYEITQEQNKIAEEYFKILYYPFNDYGVDNADLTKPQLSPYNNASLYISTPLDYIAEGKEDLCLDRIKNADTSNMGSVFFHPSLENNFITLSEDSNGCPIFNYEDNSTLKKLVNILKEKGFKMTKVTEL